MTKIRTIGLVMLIIGIALPFLFGGEQLDFFAGALGGIGLVLLITGRITFKKKA